MEIMEGDSVVAREEKGRVPSAVEERCGGESEIGGGEGNGCVADEFEVAAEVGEVGGVEDAGPATADEGKRRKGRRRNASEEI